MSATKHPWTKHAGADGKQATEEDFSRTGYGRGSRDDAQPEHNPHFANARHTPHDGVSEESASDAGKHGGTDNGGYGHSHRLQGDNKHRTQR